MKESGRGAGGDGGDGGAVAATQLQAPSCAKALIREAAAIVGPCWMQGYVVAMESTRFVLDDGSGTALVDGVALRAVDACGLDEQGLAPGVYIMVVGCAAADSSGPHGRVRVDEPTTVRNLSARPGAPMREVLWHTEVAEAWLDRSGA